MTRFGGPFEVRRVDDARRTYVRHDGPFLRYHDACLAADMARAELGGAHVVVWCRELGRVLYDSRKLPG